MCGIWFYLKNSENSQKSNLNYEEFSDLNSVRGPDVKYFNNFDFGSIGFYRLKVNDLSDLGNQPFFGENVIMVCNGEIYNHKDLEKKYNIIMKSKSDCEVILHMYKLMNFSDILKELDGVFFIILIDTQKNITYAGRDFGGRRSAFFGQTENGYFMSSYLKGIDFCEGAKQFPPAHWWSSENPQKFHKFYKLPPEIIIPDNMQIKQLLINSIKKRIENTDRNIGFFLSGGFDSSLICSIANKLIGKITTFSVGTHSDAPDIIASRRVAKHIGSNHHELIISKEDIINSLDKVIQCLESYDCTTVRASIGQYLLSKYISKKTNIKVVFSGEFADEIMGSYYYFELATNNDTAKQETKRLLENIHYYDCLRAERTTSNFGLELRIPFSDKFLLEYLYKVDYKYKNSQNQIEKKLLRDTFEGYLPSEILYRKKNGFSDAIGYDLRTNLIEYSESQVSDFEFINTDFKINPPKTKEQFLYRKIFMKYFYNQNVIPEQWMPRWTTNTLDPSGIILQKR